MTNFALILLVAAAGFGVSRWLRLPVIPLLLFAGILLSLSGLAPEADFTRNVVELGLTFLVFSAGMELNPARFGKHLKAVLWVGLVQFVVVGLAGYVLARALGFAGMTSLYLGIALSTSSTLVVVSHLKQLHQMFEPFGRLVIGVLLLQDLLMILIIVILSRSPGGLLAVGQGLAGLLFLGGMALACQRWVMPFVISRLKLDEGTLLLTVLALLFTFIGAAHSLEISPVAGAFLAGFSLSRFPVNGVARGLLISLSDFFQAIFFTTLGALVESPDLHLIAHALPLALLVVLVTPPLVTLLAEWTGLTSRPAVESGLLLAQTSEFALVLVLTGSAIPGHLPSETLPIIALVTVATMTLTPFLATDRVTGYLLHFHPLRRRLKEEGLHQNHILVLGFGAGGMWVVKPLREAGHDVVVVDDDPAVIAQLQKLMIPCLRGDGSDEKVLKRAGVDRAKLILASMRRVSDGERVLRYVSKMPVVVRVFENADADYVQRQGGIPILNSAAGADAFMDWFDKTIANSQ